MKKKMNMDTQHVSTFFFFCSRARRLTRLRCKMRFQCFHALKVPTIEFDFFLLLLSQAWAFEKFFQFLNPSLIQDYTRTTVC